MFIHKYKEIVDLTPLQADKLIIGTHLPFNVFVKDRSIVIPLFNKGTFFSSTEKEILREKDITEVYIDEYDSSTLEQYLSIDKNKITPFHEDSKVFKEYLFYKEQHYQIDRDVLIPGTKIYFTLFLLNRFTFRPLIEATVKSVALIDETIASADGDILIKKDDIPLYHSYLNSLLSAEGISKEHGLKMKTVAIRENSKIVIKELLDDPRSGEKIKESTSLVKNMVDCILENMDTLHDLLSLRSYDYYTYTHSVNVTALTIGVGTTIGLSRDTLEKLGIGAMLHDLGKSNIPYEILNKPGKLNDAEYEIMKTHVIEGGNILHMHKEIPEESLTAVLQHHERLSGRGYPLKLSGKDIKFFGKINAITDCYDALTTQRPYKPAFTPFYALSIVTKEKGDYDIELLTEFIKMLGRI